MVLAALFACAKSGAVLADGENAPITVVAIVDTVGAAGTHDAPSRLDEALVASLQSRSLQPTVLEPERVESTLAGNRGSEQREQALIAAFSGQATLLVETAPQFYSELSGQYRWTVGVKLRLASPGSTQLDSEFSVPVFLSFAHEGELEAVGAAAPIIARRVGEMVDISMASPAP